jgi:hypothetical protein
VDSLPFGTLDFENLSINVTYDELFGFMRGDEVDNRAIDLLISLITARYGPNADRLFDLGVTRQNGFDLAVRLGLFRDQNAEQFPLRHEITNNDELNKLFSGQVSNLLMSSIVSNPGELFLDMSDEILNEILAFQFNETMSLDIALPIGDRNYRITTKPFFITFDGGTNTANAHMILELTDDDNSNSLFRTMFTLMTSPSISADGHDLQLEVRGISVGNTALDNNMVTALFGMIGESDFTGTINGHNAIIYRGFSEKVVAAGLTINRLAIVNNNLRFFVTPTDSGLQNTINNIRDAIEGVINGLDTSANPEFQPIVDLVNGISGLPADEKGQALDDIKQAINELEIDQQNDFFHQLTEALNNNPNIDLAGLIPSDS